LNIEPRTLNIEQLFYTDLLDKRYEKGARGPDAYDCYGLVMEVFKRAGVALPDYGCAESPEGVAELITRFSTDWREISGDVQGSKFKVPGSQREGFQTSNIEHRTLNGPEGATLNVEHRTLNSSIEQPFPPIPCAVIFWIRPVRITVERGHSSEDHRREVCPPSFVYIASHIGAVVAPDRFIHILAGTRVSAERLSDRTWAKRLMGYYTWPK